MKLFIIGSLLVSLPVFAQSLDVKAFKKLLTDRQATLESSPVGMSKIILTSSSVDSDLGTCSFSTTSVQSILKVEGAKIIVLSKDKFEPEATEACVALGFEAFEETIVFFDAKPSLASDLENLDASAQDIKSLTRNGDKVTMLLNATAEQEDGTTLSEVMTLKYDLTQSSFKNLIFSEGFGTKTEISSALDLDISTVDLTNILFCPTSDTSSEECVQGDYSDILF